MIIELTMHNGKKIWIKSNLISGIREEVDGENEICGSIVYFGNSEYYVKELAEHIISMIYQS